MAKQRKAITVRIPQSLFEETHQLAEARGLSLNELLVESLVFRLEREREEKLYDSFTLLGQDNEDVSVDFALAAQREVLGAE